MTDDTQAEQTLGSENPEAAKEETAKEQVAKTFTQEELDQKIKDRLDRERKKYANYADLEAKAKRLEELEKAKLSDEEKAAKRVAELEEKAAELDKVIKEKELRDLKRSKIEQAIADGKMELPKGKTIDSLVKRCFGTSEEEIDSDVEELISFFPKAEPPKGQGMGTQTSEKPATAKTIDEELVALRQSLVTPPAGLDAVGLRNYKEQVAKKIIALNNRKMMESLRSG
jgi:hypothetical protein